MQEPVIKDHAEPDRPIVDDNAYLKFRPIMPEDVQQQVQPQAHDDTIKKEQIDHPILNEPRSEKTGLRGFRPGPTKTGLHNHWI